MIIKILDNVKLCRKTTAGSQLTFNQIAKIMLDNYFIWKPHCFKNI